MGRGKELTTTEVNLISRWCAQGDAIAECARRLNRSRTAILRAVRRQGENKSPPKKGRPALGQRDRQKILNTVRKLVREASATREIIAKEVRQKSGVRCSAITVRRVMRSAAFKWYRLREKPLLLPEDILERKKFAARYRSKPKSFWLKNVHAT